MIFLIAGRSALSSFNTLSLYLVYIRPIAKRLANIFSMVSSTRSYF